MNKNRCVDLGYKPAYKTKERTLSDIAFGSSTLDNPPSRGFTIEDEIPSTISHEETVDTIRRLADEIRSNHRGSIFPPDFEVMSFDTSVFSTEEDS